MLGEKQGEQNGLGEHTGEGASRLEVPHFLGLYVLPPLAAADSVLTDTKTEV